MPDFLSPAEADLRDRADKLAQELAQKILALQSSDQPNAEDSQTSLTHLAPQVREASQAAGIWDLTQAPDRVLDRVIATDALCRENVGHLPGIFAPSPTLLEGASERLRARVLQQYLAGDLRGSFGFTEPAGAPRPTWASRRGSAEENGDGLNDENSELVINGQKSYVTGGADADFISTLVEIELDGPAMVFIETDRPGVELVRRFGSLDGSHHAAFTFTDVRVPASNVLGQPGKGMRRALSQISGVRMSLAASSVGLCAFVVRLVEQHLLQKDQANAPAGSTSPNSPGNPTSPERIKLGEMRANAYAARSTVYRTARLIDAGENAVNEVMAAKVVATETVGRLVDDAVQIVGGQALADNHPLSSILRRVRSFRLAEGTTETLHSNIARGSLDMNLGRI